MIQTVKDYIPQFDVYDLGVKPRGESLSPKGLIFHVFDDLTRNCNILDIGFGSGSLGKLIKAHPDTQHWNVDGIDGWEANCKNSSLIEKNIYRNITHGLAQEIPLDVLNQYDILCLLDVIEHLDSGTAKWLLRTLLSNMNNDSRLFISTPLWFYPQHNIQSGDLEQHLIGIPAQSMMCLMPHAYVVGEQLIGGFILGKRSLEFIDFFEPYPYQSLTLERGTQLARAVGMQLSQNIAYKLS